MRVRMRTYCWFLCCLIVAFWEVGLGGASRVSLGGSKLSRRRMKLRDIQGGAPGFGNTGNSEGVSGTVGTFAGRRVLQRRDGGSGGLRLAAVLADGGAPVPGGGLLGGAVCLLYVLCPFHVLRPGAASSGRPGLASCLPRRDLIQARDGADFKSQCLRLDRRRGRKQGRPGGTPHHL